MSNLQIDVKDLTRVSKKLTREVNKLPKEFKKAMKEVAKDVVSEIQDKTPVVTGKLKRSIKSKKDKNLQYGIDSRGSASNYVNSIEYGRGKRLTQSKNKNSKASARLGAYGMFKRSEKKAKRIMKLAIDKILNRLGRKF